MTDSGIIHTPQTVPITQEVFQSQAMHALSHGNAYPTSPVEYQLFYRDDLHKWYIYNGTSWIDLSLGSSFDAHKARHQNGGADEISLVGLDGEPSTLTIHKALAAGVHGATYIPETRNADQTLSGLDAEKLFGFNSKFLQELTVYIDGQTYDPITTHIGGTGAISQGFRWFWVSSGAVAGGQALQRFNTDFMILIPSTTNGVFRTLATGVYAKQHTGFIGLIETANTYIAKDDTTKHVGFLFYDNNGTDTIYAQNADGVTCEQTDTGIAASAGWRTLEIKNDGSNVYYYIHGVLKATHNTNFPLLTDELVPVISITGAENSSAGLVAKYFYCTK